MTQKNVQCFVLYQSQEQQFSRQKETTTSENVVSSLTDIASGLGSLNIQPSEYDATEADYQQQQAEEQRKKKRKRRGFGL